MKRKYERPMAFEETFMTNEYVAACWGVACSIDSANKVDKGHYGVDHVAKHCGLDTNQHIYTNSKGVAVSMIEEGTDGLGNLTCNLYTDSTYHIQNATLLLNQETTFIGQLRVVMVELGIIRDL